MSANPLFKWHNPFLEMPLADLAACERKETILDAKTDWRARANAAEIRCFELSVRIDRAVFYLDQGNPHMAQEVLTEK